jgi:hypothetical protein
MYTDGSGKVQADDVVKAAGGWYKVHPNGYRELIHCLKDIGNAAPVIISLVNPPDDSYYETDPLTLEIKFSEIVNVVTTGGTPYVYLTDPVSGDTVELDYASGTGTDTLIFTGAMTDIVAESLVFYPEIQLNGGTILDANLNPIDNDFPSTYEQPWIVANTEVIFDVLNPADGEYEVTDPLTFTVTYSGAVTVSGTDTVYLRVTDSEDTDIDIALTSGDGTTDLVFTGPATGAADGTLTVHPALILGTDTLLVDANTNEVTVDFPAGYVAPELEIITVTP